MLSNESMLYTCFFNPLKASTKLVERAKRAMISDFTQTIIDFVFFNQSLWFLFGFLGNYVHSGYLQVNTYFSYNYFYDVKWQTILKQINKYTHNSL